MSDLDPVIQTLNDHLLTGPLPGQCRCGWGSGASPLAMFETMGRSHSEHVAEQLRDAGLLR